MSDTPFYEHHVFFCLNQRKPGERTCCADKGAQAAQEHAKNASSNWVWPGKAKSASTRPDVWNAAKKVRW